MAWRPCEGLVRGLGLEPKVLTVGWEKRSVCRYVWVGDVRYKYLVCG